MLAFVTGATGFVGSHVARALAEQGAELRLLVRATSDPRNIQDLRAERVIGDLRDPDSLDPAMAGCDVVFHVAADYRLWVRSGADVSLEREWHPSSSGSGTKEPRSARGLYIERCDHGIYLEWQS